MAGRPAGEGLQQVFGGATADPFQELHRPAVGREARIGPIGLLQEGQGSAVHLQGRVIRDRLLKVWDRSWAEPEQVAASPLPRSEGRRVKLADQRRDLGLIVGRRTSWFETTAQ